MACPTIIVEKRDHIAKLIFNRPEAANSFTTKMLEEVIQALNEIDRDPQTRVLILTGAGKHFQTATDLREFFKEGESAMLEGWSAVEIREFMTHYPQKITRTLLELEKPTIAMVNGTALADGFDWALACDLRVGSTNARFVQGSTVFATFPNPGTTWLLPRAIGINKALEFLYLGGTFTAQQAYDLGILNRLVPPEDLEKETIDLAHQIAEQPPIVLRFLKKQVYMGLHLTLDQALELCADAEVLTLKTEDHKLAAAAFRRRKKAKYIGK